MSYNTDSLKIPPHTREAFERYFRYGFAPGGFGQAVLENNLTEAVFRADHINRGILYQIVSWLQEYAPAGSWGSPVIVQGWMSKNAYFEAYQRQVTFKLLSEVPK